MLVVQVVGPKAGCILHTEALFMPSWQKYAKKAADEIQNDSTIGCSCTQTDGDNAFEQFDCLSASETRYEKLELILSHNYNGGDITRYWGGITAKNIEATISGVQINVENSCEFSVAKSITINGNLKCGNLILSPTSKIIVNRGFTFGFDKLTMKATER